MAIANCVILCLPLANNFLALASSNSSLELSAAEVTSLYAQHPLTPTYPYQLLDRLELMSVPEVSASLLLGTS
jgi:hypothetical protein